MHTLQELDQAKTPNKCLRSIRPQDPIPDNHQTSSMTENDQDRSAAPFTHEWLTTGIDTTGDAKKTFVEMNKDRRPHKEISILQLQKQGYTVIERIRTYTSYLCCTRINPDDNILARHKHRSHRPRTLSTIYIIAIVHQRLHTPEIWFSSTRQYSMRCICIASKSPQVLVESPAYLHIGVGDMNPDARVWRRSHRDISINIIILFAEPVQAISITGLILAEAVEQLGAFRGRL